MKGRPTKLTPDTIKGLTLVFSNGASVKDACAFVGIDVSTYHKWMARGEKAQSGEFFDFFHAIKRAQAEMRLDALARIRVASKGGNWQAAAWLLERSDPDNWALRQKIMIEGGVPIDLINQTIRALAGANLSASDVFHDLIREAAEQQRISATGASEADRA